MTSIATPAPLGEGRPGPAGGNRPEPLRRALRWAVTDSLVLA